MMLNGNLIVDSDYARNALGIRRGQAAISVRW